MLFPAAMSADARRAAGCVDSVNFNSGIGANIGTSSASRAFDLSVKFHGMPALSVEAFGHSQDRA
jgi:hypothetical protein